MSLFDSVKKYFLLLVLFQFLSACAVLNYSPAYVYRIFFNINKVKNPIHGSAEPKLNKAQKINAKQSTKRSCYDVNYYKLEILIDPSNKFVSGSVSIDAQSTGKVDTIQIDLYKNLKLKTVYFNHVLIETIREEGAIYIVPKSILKNGEKFNLKIEYEGFPKVAKRPPWEGGTVWKKDKDGKAWCGVACETEGASLWWPNKDEVSDEPDSMDINITTNKNLNVVSNGLLTDTSLTAPKLKTYKWHVSYPINNYNVSFYIGNFQLVTDTFFSKVGQNNFRIDYYVLPENNNRISIEHLHQVKKQLAFYEQLFGPYPWPKDGFRLVEAPFAGMEHQSAIAYGSGFKNDKANGFDHVILHETAHEWWGNSVTAADFSDIWLQEGFATYAEALFLEHEKGYERYLDFLLSKRIFISNKRSIVKEKGKRDFHSNEEDVYFKGAWVLHSLRTLINKDSLFFDILKSFRIQNHCKQIYTSTFIELVNEKTHSDLTWFFKQYLYQREAPILMYFLKDEDFYFKWKSVGEDFSQLPVEVLRGDKKYIIFPNSKLQKIKMSGHSANKIIFSDQKMYYGTLSSRSLLNRHL